MDDGTKGHPNHYPVLLAQVVEYLAPQSGDTYLDVTAGYGGHAQAILEQTKAPAVLIDRDQQAVDYLRQLFGTKDVQIIHSDYLTASYQLQSAGRQFDLLLADLGVSSPHLNMASRGFSFQAVGPLDMRMDQRQSLTAANIVNTYNEKQLSDLLRKYGEEKQALQFAKAIIANRPIKTTAELAYVIAKATKKGRAKTHPATKSFQAIRIAVNDELNQLEQALPVWIDLLKPGGRLVVISFHSLEDRLVKQTLAQMGGNGYDAILKILTKHPVTANRQEIVFNPRARSAKLRAAVKIKKLPRKFSLAK